MNKLLVSFLLVVLNLSFSLNAYSESINGQFKSSKGELIRIDDSGKLYLLTLKDSKEQASVIGKLVLLSDAESKYDLAVPSASKYLGTYLVFSNDFEVVTVHWIDRSKETEIESKSIYTRVEK